MFAGTRPARLFRSADGGESWEELTSFRRIPSRLFWFSSAEPLAAYVQAIAVSACDPATVVAGRSWPGSRRVRWSEAPTPAPRGKATAGESCATAIRWRRTRVLAGFTRVVGAVARSVPIGVRPGRGRTGSTDATDGRSRPTQRTLSSGICPPRLASALTPTTPTRRSTGVTPVRGGRASVAATESSAQHAVRPRRRAAPSSTRGGSGLRRGMGYAQRRRDMGAARLQIPTNRAITGETRDVGESHGAGLPDRRPRVARHVPDTRRCQVTAGAAAGRQGR